MVVICSHLSSLFNILLYHSFFEHSHDHCYCFPSEQTTEHPSAQLKKEMRLEN
ncbi:unnamed protein product [Prunus brigantina]